MSFVTNVRFTASPDVDDQAYIAPTLGQRLQNYYEPAILFYIAVFTFFKVVFRTIFTNPLGLFRFSEIRSKAFAETWQTLGSGNSNVGPLKNIVPLFNSADGIVLDLGPGDGRQMMNYTSPGIKAMYGIEPCEELHPGLKIEAEKVGLGEKYHIITAGAEKESLVPALTKVGLLKGKAEGVFDTIICAKVLCSVPNQKETVAGLYDLLKPGGRMIICEHIKNPWRTRKGSIVARVIQQLFMLQGWSFFLSGCGLTKNTGEVLRKVADKDNGWEKIDLEYVVEWGTIPFVVGELVKKTDIRHSLQ